MRRLSVVACMMAGSLLAGCGGSSSSITGTKAVSAGGTSVAKVSVAASPSTIAADGSTTSSITATALDAGNAGVSGATVTFSSSTGGTVAVVTGTTDTSGIATATLSNVSAAAGTNLTVSANVGAIAGSATVGVVDIKQALSLETDLPQIPSDGSQLANISAVLRDANNNALAGTTVQFSADSGVLVVTAAGAVTDANGIAKATLSPGTDPTDRAITVKATAGAASALPLSVLVSGTTLTLTCPPTLVSGNSGNCSLSLANSAGKGIAHAIVTLVSAKGNTLSAATVTTDVNGRASFTVNGIVGGTDTISASTLGLTKTTLVVVSTESFNIAAPDGTQVDLGTPRTVIVTWLNGGNKVVGQPVSFAATRGTLSATTVNTDSNGTATVTITSSGAGIAIVQATAADVSAQLNLDFVAVLPSQISVQAGPASVAILGQSTISALVRDTANNLVEGATVNFEIVTDPTNGGLSVASATTDAQGRAQTVYTAGASSSGANAVEITAKVGAVAPAKTTLTVGGETVFLSLGTGNTIDVSQGVAIYQIIYTVFAVDSQGAALSNVPITVSVLPVAYGKGVLGNCPKLGPDWEPAYSTAPQTTGTTTTIDPDAYPGNTNLCKNEDTDYTGNIDSLGLNGAGIPNKDYNDNGKLDPGNVAVAVPIPSSGITDSNGRLNVAVTYPRDHAYWVEVQLVVSATVQGTQSSTSSTFLLQGAVTDYGCSTGPPGPVSPYGVGNTCANPN